MSLLFSIVFYVNTVLAQGVFQRQANLEWGAIPGAAEYELEISSLSQGAVKPMSLILKEPKWSGSLNPGRYTYRLRIRNSRGQTSAWTPANPLNIKLGKITTISPSAEEVLKSTGNDSSDITFQWQPMPGSSFYKLTIQAFREQPEEKTTKDSFLKMNLPAGKSYQWKVEAINEELGADVMDPLNFTIQSRPLDRPQVVPPSDAFVEKISWTIPDGAQKFDILLYRWNPSNKAWVGFKKFSDFSGQSLPFAPAWPGGPYRIQVFAKSETRPKSEPGDLRFLVREGDRSPEAKKNRGQKKGIPPWTFGVGFRASNISYVGSNAESGNNNLSYSTMAGSGVIDLTYVKPKSTFGFSTNLELSSLSVGDKNSSFNKLSLLGIYRPKPLYRVYYGVAYKEQPETIFDPLTEVYTINLIKFVALETRIALQPRLGFRAHLGVSYPFMKQQTPNNQVLNPELSYDLGFGYGLKIQNQLTAVMGYTYNKSAISYKAVDFNQSIDSFANPGDLNKVSSTGHYFNFIMEWGF